MCDFDAYDSIKIFINQNPDSKKKYSEMLLNYNEISIIEDLLELLLPFFELTEFMSATKYVTASVIQPTVTRL